MTATMTIPEQNETLLKNCRVAYARHCADLARAALNAAEARTPAEREAALKWVRANVACLEADAAFLAFDIPTRAEVEGLVDGILDGSINLHAKTDAELADIEAKLGREGLREFVDERHLMAESLVVGHRIALTEGD
jgi:hypothetical protein